MQGTFWIGLGRDGVYINEHLTPADSETHSHWRAHIHKLSSFSTQSAIEALSLLSQPALSSSISILSTSNGKYEAFLQFAETTVDYRRFLNNSET